MATVLSPGGEPGRTVLAVRIGENEDQQDRLPELLALARSLESVEAVSRAVAEVTAIQSAGLGRAVSEILTMAEDLRRAGQPLEIALRRRFSWLLVPTCRRRGHFAGRRCRPA